MNLVSITQNASNGEEKKSRRRIVMFPWLAFGHASPYMELAKKLSQHNLEIHFCSSPIIVESMKSKLPPNSCIQLVELNLPSLPDLPPDMHSTTGLPPHLMSSLLKAFDMAAPEFHSILIKLNPHLLITELFQPWAFRSASSLNIPVAFFQPSGVGTLTQAVHRLTNSGLEFPFPELVMSHHWSSKALTSIPKDSLMADYFNRFLQWIQNIKLSSHLVLVNSFRGFEDKYIDYFSVSLNKTVVPVGPLVPEVDQKTHWILEWLDKKEPRSTVYISFGSENYLSKKDMEEMGMGLEMSGVNFIWVVRFPKGEEMAIEEALPDGFMERVGDKGIVVHGWAPQVKILNHLSIGGFVSHCGWSSTVESVVSGVPIIAMPMQVDQPLNMKVAMAAGVAVEAARGVDGAIERQGVAHAIKQVLFGETGDNFYRKAKQVSENLKINQGQNIEGCVAELNKLWESIS